MGCRKAVFASARKRKGYHATQVAGSGCFARIHAVKKTARWLLLILAQTFGCKGHPRELGCVSLFLNPTTIQKIGKNMPQLCRWASCLDSPSSSLTKKNKAHVLVATVAAGHTTQRRNNKVVALNASSPAYMDAPTRARN